MSPQKLARVILIALTSGMMGCEMPAESGSDSPHGSEHPAVVGRVLNQITLEGIKDVKVSISGAQIVTTGADGTYEVGEYSVVRGLAGIRITASAPGYTSATVEVEIGPHGISIPTLFLLPLPAPTVLSASGGTLALGGAGEIDFPAGALMGDVPVTAVVFPTLIRSGQDPQHHAAALGLTLLPLGLQLSKPAKITLTLPVPHSPKSRLAIRQLNPLTLQWHDTDSAIVAEDGRSAVLFTSVFSPISASLVSITYDYDVNAAVAVPSYYMTSYSGCVTQPFTTPVITVTATTSASLTFTSSYFSAQPVKSSIAAILGSDSDNSLWVGIGEELVTKQYIDTYSGSVTARYHNTDTSEEIEETRTYTFVRWRFVRSKRDCHNQGG